MEKLELSRRKVEKPQPISLDDFEGIFEEMGLSPVAKVEAVEKEKRVVEKNERLGVSLDLTKEEKPGPKLTDLFFDDYVPSAEELEALFSNNDEELIEEPEEQVQEPEEELQVEPVLEEEIEEVEETEPEITEEEPEEVVEEVLEEPEEEETDPFMQSLSDQLSALYKNEQKEITPADQGVVILERKILQLEKQLADTRRMVLEFEPGTMVSGMGNSSGGGEVQVQRMDDVNMNLIQDGDSLVWDATLQQFVPASVVSTGNRLNLEGVNRSLWRLQEKFISMDERIQEYIALDTKFVELEANTPIREALITTTSEQTITTEDGRILRSEYGTEQAEGSRVFIDQLADGETTTFIVRQDSNRNVFTLDGVPQPTVQVPRGDIIIFDIRHLDDPDVFDIFQNGVVLQTGYTRDDTAGAQKITIRTANVDASLERLYYRHTTINGLGWLIQITDN